MHRRMRPRVVLEPVRRITLAGIPGSCVILHLDAQPQLIEDLWRGALIRLGGDAIPLRPLSLKSFAVRPQPHQNVFIPC